MGLSDKARHTAQQGKGKAEEAAGRALGDEQLEASGRKDQAAASVKQAGERVKDAAAEAARGVGDAVEKAADRVGRSTEEGR